MQESVNFDRAAHFYDATRGFPDGIAEQIGAFITKTANLTEDDMVLEIGVGTGRIALPLSEHVRYVVGADISHQMLRVLLDKLDGRNVFPCNADGYSLPYGNNIFDAIAVIHVLHLVPHPEQILAEIKRTLKPDGHLLRCYVGGADGEKDPVIQAQIASAPKNISSKNRKRLPDVIASAGWQIEQEAIFNYTETLTAREVYNNVRNRAWSSLWYVSDEALQQSADTIGQAIQDHYIGDYDTQITEEKTFTVQILKASS